ncbi:hypothetical protein DUNSADRAFT_6333 [Dunaliella salina]|uniref:Encoded protein n=1 Tax=Dunaliella salina TaxID=3046 RepID=A0ABQ7FTT3_DUNSA|nr:hypothetical protein DUNSADRAFT_6333 [Dunaliella salina]|eukprot:KAF5825854.1 hypothetical protein DUNSADRAFT_6333 [Dunaliella salina]
MDASAAAPNGYPPSSVTTSQPVDVQGAKGGGGGGGEAPCYSHPPMRAPPNWCPSIQRTAFLDLGAQRTVASNWDEGDEDWKPKGW